MTGFARAHGVLVDATVAGVFPSATAEVGSSAAASWTDAVGTLMFTPSAEVTTRTPYDLASLTKVIATTTVAMDLVERASVNLDEQVSDCFAEWTGADREPARVRDLLEHASGLSARLLAPPPATARGLVPEICSIPLQYPLRCRSIYSALGFLLLGFLPEQRGDGSLAAQFGRIWPRADLTFELDAALKRKCAPSRPMDDDSRRGRVLVGEVHDNYAAALGGVAGHAGLF